jgi:hypothetical protein
MNERLPLLEPRLPSRFQERFWHKCIKYIPVTIFFSFIVYSYYNTNIELSTNLSVYGLFALLNYSSQFVMAVINKYKMDKISKSIDQGYIPIAVCVAGYREREDYFLMRTNIWPRFAWKSLVPMSVHKSDCPV